MRLPPDGFISGGASFPPDQIGKSRQLNKSQGRGDDKSLPFPGMAGHHVFPCLNEGERMVHY
jgi:hypothetical protein